MLKMVQIRPEQVDLWWPVLRQSLKPNEERLSAVLSALQKGHATAWLMVEGERPEMRMYAGVITVLVMDPLVGGKHLLIYDLVAFRPLEEAHYKLGLGVLRDYAEGQGCRKIAAATKVEKVLEIVGKLGGRAVGIQMELEV